MQRLKETQRERAERLAAEEGGRRFRAKSWSKKGKSKCPKAMRRKFNKITKI